MGRLAAEMEREFVVGELAPCFKSLSEDDYEGIRAACIKSIALLAKPLTNENNKEITVPVILGGIKDKSWRIRHSIAENFEAMTEFLDGSIIDEILIAPFLTLLKDPVELVRSSAINAVRLNTRIDPDKIKGTVLTELLKLVHDPSCKVRAKLAETLCVLTTYVTEKRAIAEVAPALIELLKDADYGVKLGVLRNMQSVEKTIGTELVICGLVKILRKFAKEGRWEVKCEATKAVVYLAKTLGREYYMKNVEETFLLLLLDDALAVREAAIESLYLLADEFKQDWIMNAYIPRAIEMYTREKQNYLCRMSVLSSVVVTSRRT
eukprot:TRINITY_DN7893_c0_g5_i1.p1 TRINITY_DN7893_c0_g5~~TRINITY_DN7893_c0_g5_i1.p1  ORF type:complete len:322 (+),score=103.69 TRINITY_DN7893_c0_g5_i1:703-1668(+)